MLNRRNFNKPLNDALKKIEGLTTSDSVEYIVNRINDEKYQGHSSVNHNRITIEKIVAFLETFKEGKYIEVPKGDAGKGNFDINNYKDFDDLVKNFQTKIGQGTQNTLRKNSSPDFARYGFIERYRENSEGKKLFTEDGKRMTTNGYEISWKISKLGIQFLEATSIEREEILSDAANNLHENIITVIFEVLKEVKTISFFEFMMFVNKPETLSITEDIAKSVLLIKDFRAIGKANIEGVNKFLSSIRMDSQNSISKKYKFDYGNWKNDTQQLVDTFKKLFIFKITQNGFNASVDKLGKKIRNKQIYKDYNATHNIEKRLGYEYHHIVPLAKAKNHEQLALIDNEDNLIYLEAGVHAIFTQMGNPYIIFESFTKDYIQLMDLYAEKFRVKNDKSELDLLIIPKMIKHNQRVLRSLGYEIESNVGN